MTERQIKLKWYVDPAPTGLARVTAKRAWPTATFDEGRVAARIIGSCQYAPSIANDPTLDIELKVHVAKYYLREADGVLTFDWRQLKQRESTLLGAKLLVQNFFKKNPSYLYPEDWQ